MKNPEIHMLTLGQLMCLSALIESEIYQTGSQINGDTITSLVSSFIHLYQTYEFMRESIQAVFTKLLTNVPAETHGVKIIEKVVAELLVSGGNLKETLFAHSDNLSLFLSLRHVYLSAKYRDQSTKAAKHLTLDIFADEEDLLKLKHIVGKSVYIYPRLHTSLPLLIDEIYLRPSTTKQRLNLIKKLVKILFENYFFNDDIYQGIKSSSTRPKFLHIGLKFWELLGKETLARESKNEARTTILNALINEYLLRVFVRGLSIQKGMLYEVAKEIKTSIIKMLELVQIPPEHAMQLLQALFGPNTATRLAVRRNQDLLKVISSQMDSETVAAYL